MMKTNKQRIALEQRMDLLNLPYHQNQKIINQKSKCISLMTQKQQSHENSLSQNKQNSVQLNKKIKLKLKTIPSKQLQKNKDKNSISNIQTLSYKKFKQNNSVPKITNNHKNIANNNKIDNKHTINSKHKPNIVYFSLKSLKQNVPQSKQLNQRSNQIKNDNSKEKFKPKNYQLSSFISQIIQKIQNKPICPTKQCISLHQLGQKSICYSELITILHSMSMIRYCSENKYKIQHEDQKQQLQKIYLLWRILKINCSQIKFNVQIRHHINCIDLIILLTAILNIHVENIEELIEILTQKLRQRNINQIQSKNQSINNIQEPTHIFLIKNKKLLNPIQKINYYNSSFLNLNTEIKSQLFKQFQLFRINRLNSQSNMKSSNKQNLQIQNQCNQISIQSLISPKSQQLAIYKRRKILQEIQNTQQNSLTKQSIPQSQLNLFLSYKNTKKCNHQIQCENKNKLPTQKTKQKLQKQKKFDSSKINKNVYIPSQKIKFSQMNSILKMQKGRQLKFEKQLILSKGWTNNGKISGRQFKLSSTQATSQYKKQRQNIINNEQLNIKQKRILFNKVSFFQIRKNSFKQILKSGQSRIIGNKQQQKQQKYIDQDKYMYKNEDNIIQDNKNDDNTFIRHASKQNSIQTISIDDNESINLQNEQFNDEEDFTIGNQQGYQEIINQLHNKQYSIPNNQYLYQNNILNQQNIQQPQSNCKTFNTETNQQIQYYNHIHQQQLLKQSKSTQQTRVIKSYLKIPILYVDVNMDQSKKQRIIIFEQDNPTNLAQQFGTKHHLDHIMIGRLQQMLKQQISGILGRIDQEQDQYDDTKQDIFNNLTQSNIQQILQQQ